jgi:hypothetical protein
MSTPWTLTIDEALYNDLHAHLFPGDGDEHGAVIAAGVVKTARGTRLLARALIKARDGVDFVPGRRSYRLLTPEFVNNSIRFCRDQKLAYLAVHNHHGDDAVEFSSTDNYSHEHGYPALLDIAGQPVGALVLARNALAGDIWTPDRSRRRISETVILGRNLRRIHPSPPPSPPKADLLYDRQARWFGDRGQALLARMKVGVIGGGGVGQPLIGMLSRLGAGEIVLVEPERIEPTNLPRLPDARRIDAMIPLRRIKCLVPLAERLSTSKIRLAKRVAQRANPGIRFSGIMADVSDPRGATPLVDCDFLFLAADSHLARMVFNALVHQYLIPGIQIGTRIEVDERLGTVGDIRSSVRLVLPYHGCLRCNQMISSNKLQEEALAPAERERNRYVKEVPAPSVITFNTASAAQAVTDFSLMLGGFIDPKAPIDYLRSKPRQRRFEPVRPVANKAKCRDCGSAQNSRLARGDFAELPLRRLGERDRSYNPLAG